MKRIIFIFGLIFWTGLLLSQKSGTIVMDEAVRHHFRKEILIPDIPGYITLKCDFHIHTVYSDGVVWPTVRVNEAWEDGLDAIAITDHIEGHPNKFPGQKHMAYEIALPVAKSIGLILIKGGEISRSMPPGHFNALFIKDIDAINLPDYYDAIGEAVKQGGFIIWNHPGWRKQQPDTTKWMAEHEVIYGKGWMHGIEVFNEKEWYPEALQWALDKNLAFTGNSDVHDIYEYYYDKNKYPVRPLTLVFTKERTEESIKEAMFERRTAALFFNKLIGKREFIEPIVNQSIKVHNSHCYQNGYTYFAVKNISDIEFTMLKTSKDNSELPEKIILPCRGTIILRAKQPEGETLSCSYKLLNVLTGVEEYYEYKFIVR